MKARMAYSIAAAMITPAAKRVTAQITRFARVAAAHGER
jgi:hypothetical protein